MERSRLRPTFDGLGGYAGAAGVLIFFALLTLLLTIQSQSDMLLWTGHHTIGVEDNGLVRYRVDGENYTHVAKDPIANGQQVDIYYKASDPFTARVDSTAARVVDIAVTAVPLALAAGVFWLGVRRRRRTRQATSDEDAFGTGLDSDFVARQLEQLRRPPP
jgi:hypothetical protein